jgi:hypothetical protein
MRVTELSQCGGANGNADPIVGATSNATPVTADRILRMCFKPPSSCGDIVSIRSQTHKRDCAPQLESAPSPAKRPAIQATMMLLDWLALIHHDNQKHETETPFVILARCEADAFAINLA